MDHGVFAMMFHTLLQMVKWLVIDATTNYGHLVCVIQDISIRVLGRNPTQLGYLLHERITQAFQFRTRFRPKQIASD